MSRVLLLTGLVVSAVVVAALWLLVDAPHDSGEVSLPRPVPEAVGGSGRMDVLDVSPTTSPNDVTRIDVPAPPPGVDLVAAAHAAGRPAETGRVLGVLVDAEGTPAAGEPVDLYVFDDAWEARERDDDAIPQPIARAVSDGAGRFTLAARAGTGHTLVAGGARYARRALPDVFAGDALRVVLEAGASVRGVVLDAEGLPVPDAAVAVLGQPQQMLTRADEDGRFALGPLGSAPVKLVGYADGFGVGLLDEVVPGWEDLELVLPPTQPIALRVLSREGDEPVAGAHVEAVLELEARDASSASALPELVGLATLAATVADEGRATLLGAPSIGFVLRATADGYFPAENDHYVTRAVREGEEVVVWMRPLTSIDALVIGGDDGAHVPGVVVQVLDDLERVQLQGTSDADGRALLTLDAWLGEGRPVLFAEDAEGRTARVRPGREELESGEPIELALYAPVELTVQVVDAGEPVSGAEVCVRSGGQARTLGITDDGGFAQLVHRLAGEDVGGLRVEARVGERASLPQLVDLGDAFDPSVVVTIDLAGGLFVDGVVIDGAGLPVPGARIAGRGYADPEGVFHVGPYAADDRAKLLVSAEGMRTTLVRVDVPARDVVIELEPVVRWEGRALDASTLLPLDDFSLRLEREDLRDGVREFRDVGARMTRDPTEPGAFSVELPEEGRYRLRVLAHDMLPAFSYVADFDGVHAPPFADVTASAAAVLLITLLDASGLAVPGVGVSVFAWEDVRDAKRAPGKGGARRTGRTDEDGRVRLPLGMGGAFRVAVGRGLWLDDGRLDVLPGPPLERTYRLGPTGDVQLRLVDDLGRAVTGARITLKTRGRDAPMSVHRTLRPDGPLDEVRIERLPPGTYTVEVRHRALSAPEHEVAVAGARTTFLDITMGEGGARGGKAGGGKASGKKSGGKAQDAANDKGAGKAKGSGGKANDASGGKGKDRGGPKGKSG